MFYQANMSKKGIVFLTLILSLQIVSAFVPCSASHYDYVGIQTLGKQKEFSCAINYVNNYLTPLQNVTFWTQGNNYIIYNTSAKLVFIDQEQKAVIIGDETIVVYGGRVAAYLTFNWEVKGKTTRKGTGEAFGLSDSPALAKNIIIQNGEFYNFELIDYQDVQWSQPLPFSLTRYSPTDITDEDKATLIRMLNNIMGMKTVRNLLEEQIKKVFGYYLGHCLYDKNHHSAPHFDYTWVPSTTGKPAITIPMQIKTYLIEVTAKAISNIYEVEPKDSNSSNWICGNRPVPFIPLNPLIYKDNQKIVSLDFYENMVRYAASKGYLNTELKQEWWGSPSFQFVAGNLFQVFPDLPSKYQASQKVLGNCQALQKGIKLQTYTNSTLITVISFNCDLRIKQKKVVDFSVGLNIIIAPIAEESQLNFKVSNYDQSISFYPVEEFKMQNTPLAIEMVRDCLKRLYEGYLFGSGFPLTPASKYPHFLGFNSLAAVIDLKVDPDSKIVTQKKKLQVGSTK